MFEHYVVKHRIPRFVLKSQQRYKLFRYCPTKIILRRVLPGGFRFMLYFCIYPKHHTTWMTIMIPLILNFIHLAMKNKYLATLLMLLYFAMQDQAQPIRLHPENPHYFD